MPKSILKARAQAKASAAVAAGQSRVSRLRGSIDMPFLMLTIVLVAIGLVMLLSASYPSAYYDLKGNTDGDPFYYFTRQGAIALAGIAVMLVVSLLNYQGLKGLAMPILVLAFLLMLAVQVPGLGVESGGATRWLRYPVQWQPSELGKIALIVFFAARLSNRDRRRPLRFRRNTAPGRFGNFLERIGFFELIPYVIVLAAMIGLLYLQLECPGGNAQGTMPQNDHLFQAIRSGNPYPVFLADLIGDPLDIGISSFGLLGVYHMNALVFFHRPGIIRDFIGVKDKDQLDLFECLEVCQNIHQLFIFHSQLFC